MPDHLLVVCIFITGLILVELKSIDFSKNNKRSQRSITTNFNLHSTYTALNGFKCFVCHPGFYHLGDCAVNHTTAVCKECKQGTYNSNFNIAIKCAVCTTVCTDKNAEIVRRCNSTVDAKCRCKDGFYNHSTGSGEWKCLPHTVCKAGNEPYQKGNATHDTICRKCKMGFYSTVRSSTESCKQCRACSNDDVISVCNDTMNTVCESDGYDNLLLPVSLGIGAVVIISIIILLLLTKTKACRPNDSTRANFSQESSETTDSFDEPDENRPMINTSMTIDPPGESVHQTQIRSRSETDSNSTSRGTCSWPKLFSDLTLQLPLDRWQFVVRSLFADYYDTSELESKMEEIRYNNSQNIKEEIYQCFISWYKRAGDKACLEDIISAIERNKIPSVGENLKRDFPGLLRIR